MLWLEVIEMINLAELNHPHRELLHQNNLGRGKCSPKGALRIKESQRIMLQSAFSDDRIGHRRGVTSVAVTI